MTTAGSVDAGLSATALRPGTSGPPGQPMTALPLSPQLAAVPDGRMRPSLRELGRDTRPSNGCLKKDGRRLQTLYWYVRVKLSRYTL